MEALARILFLADIAFFFTVLIAIPCVLIALPFRKGSRSH